MVWAAIRAEEAVRWVEPGICRAARIFTDRSWGDLGDTRPWDRGRPILRPDTWAVLLSGWFLPAAEDRPSASWEVRRRCCRSIWVAVEDTASRIAGRRPILTTAIAKITMPKERQRRTASHDDRRLRHPRASLKPKRRSFTSRVGRKAALRTQDLFTLSGITGSSARIANAAAVAELRKGAISETGIAIEVMDAIGIVIGSEAIAVEVTIGIATEIATGTAKEIAIRSVNGRGNATGIGIVTETETEWIAIEIGIVRVMTVTPEETGASISNTINTSSSSSRFDLKKDLRARRLVAVGAPVSTRIIKRRRK